MAVVFVVFSTGLALESRGMVSVFFESSGIVVAGGGDVVGDSVVLLLTLLKMPSDRDSFRASRDPSLSSPSCARARSRNSSAARRTYN